LKREPEMKPKPSRRRLLKWLAALGLAGTGAGFAFGRERNAYYSGPVSDHFDGVRFFNPSGHGPKGVGTLLKWTFGTRAEAWPAAFASPHADTPPPRIDGGTVRVTYIGHASFLVQAVGRNILIDPVYAERASPVSFAGPKRVNAPGIAFDTLPRIDVVLVTHNHYDHMDTETIGKLWRRNQPRIITPLGNDTIIKAAVAGAEATVIDWGGWHDAVCDWRYGVRRRFDISSRGAAFSADRSGAAADRRLRAALHDAEPAHESRGGGDRARTVRRQGSPRPSLGHVSTDQRSD
jgi:hypothetical protein